MLGASARRAAELALIAPLREELLFRGLVVHIVPSRPSTRAPPRLMLTLSMATDEEPHER